MKRWVGAEKLDPASRGMARSDDARCQPWVWDCWSIAVRLESNQEDGQL